MLEFMISKKGLGSQKKDEHAGETLLIREIREKKAWQFQEEFERGYLKGKETEKKKQQKLPSTGLLCKCSQEPGLDQTTARSQKHQVHSHPSPAASQGTHQQEAGSEAEHLGPTQAFRYRMGGSHVAMHTAMPTAYPSMSCSHRWLHL